MLSVMVMGAGAAFSDQDKIENTEAVDMATALNIIGGYQDGTFRPDGNVTRGEMAKMICVALNGGKEPVLSDNGAASFTDTTNHWAKKYIEACVSQGIVGGMGNGTFAPDGKVTGVQAAKMLLIALGYRADEEGFGGNGWDTNVNVAATAKGLYDAIEDIDPSAPLTRDDAAQMIWNTLQAAEVEYESTLVTENGQLVAKVTVKDKTITTVDANNVVTVVKLTLLADKYGTTETVGVMTDVSYDSKKAEYTYSIDVAGVDADKDPTFKSSADYSDLFRQNVKVISKTEKGKTTVFGMFAEDSSIVADGIVNDIKDIENLNQSTAKVTISGVEYKLDLNDSGKNVIVGAYPFASETALEFSEIGDMPGYGSFAFKAIDNNDNDKIDTVVVYPVTVAKLTYVNSTGVRVGAASYTYEDDTIYEGAQKDDWAVIVNGNYTVDGKAVLTKADVVSGKVTSVKTDTTGKITTEVRVDGTWYKAAIKDDTTISTTVDLVVYNGYYFYADAASTNLDVAVVTGVGNYNQMNKTTEVRLMFADGSEEVVNVAKWDSVEDNVSSKTANVMVSYDIDKDEYTLTTVSHGQEIGNSGYKGLFWANNTVTYNKDKAAIIANNNVYDVASDAVVVLYDGDDYTYMTGKDLLTRNTFTMTGAYAARNDSMEICALFGQTSTSITTGDVLYGYITDSYTALNADEDEVVYIDVIVNGKKMEDVETDQSKTKLADFAPGVVVTYTMDGDVMCVTAEKPTDYTKAAIKEFNDARVLFYKDDISKTDRFLLTEDTVIIAIDSDDADNVLYAGDSLMAANAATFDEATGAVKTYYKNAMYNANDDGEIEVIFVEVASDEEF